VIAFGLDPEHGAKTVAALCLAVASEVLSITLTLAAKFLGVTPRWKKALDILAFAPPIVETIGKSWASGGEGCWNIGH
jgi:hypothetical protein